MTDFSILKELMRNQPNPMERLAGPERQMCVQSPWPVEITARSSHFIKTGERIAVLECGHHVLTKSFHRAACRRCGEMIREGHDYDAFRRLGMPEDFHWPEDPLLLLNEPDSREREN